MKKAGVLICLLFYSLSCTIAQIPNPGFENWEPEFFGEKPTGWQTLNFLSFLSNPPSAFKVSGIDKHSGNYALKIKSVYLHNNPMPSLIDDTMGVAFTGLINISPTSYKYGFPINQRYEKLTFWSKYFPVGEDEAGMKVQFTNWNGVKRDTIAEGEIIIYEQPTYSFFELNISDYYSNDVPDTAIIFFGSSRKSSVSRVGSTLYIDDLAFTGWVGIDESLEQQKSSCKVFPNPAKDNVSFLTNNNDADAIEIKDVYGRTINTFVVYDKTITINTDFMAAGTYFYTLMDKDRKTISTGRFNVVK